MALEWFEPDLLLSEPSTFRPLWMDSYSEFVLELQTNFGPHDPVGDAEQQLRHLSMQDDERVNKYIVDFNRLASQVRGYGDGALWHLFYLGLPDQIKDEISCAGKPLTLSGMRTKAQSIDSRYWEHRAELHHQTSASTSPSSSEISITSDLPTSTSDPYDPTSKSDTSDAHSLPPSDSNSDPSDDSSFEDSDPSSSLGSDGKSSDI